MRKITLILAVTAVAVAAVLAPSVSARSNAGEADIVTTAVNNGSFKTLASLLTATGLVDTLKGPGPFTVLAPTDAAFAKVPKATLDALAADPAKLKAVLLYHVIAGKVPSSEVVKLTSAKTVNGANVAIKVDGGSVFVNNAKVVIPDVMASNGVIHVIDTVLLPPAPKVNIVKTAVAAGSFKTLTSLVTKAGLAKTLSGGKWTVFAPTDAAFAKVPKATLATLGKNPALLKKVLLFHVVKGAVPASTVVTLNGKLVKTMSGDSVKVKVAGGKVFLNGSTRVTATDVMASNGVIHVINKVLIPAS
jgi:transforming growth factor-beta-induced protein